MSDYIKREDAIAAVGRASNTIRTIQRIEKIPAADVVERGVMEQYRYERDVAEKQLAEIGKCIGEQMDDVVERQVSGWLVITCDNVVSSYQCENCWHISEDASNFCPECGSDMLYLTQNNASNALEKKGMI